MPFHFQVLNTGTKNALNENEKKKALRSWKMGTIRVDPGIHLPEEIR